MVLLPSLSFGLVLTWTINFFVVDKLYLNCDYFQCATYILFGWTDFSISCALTSLYFAMLYICAVEEHLYFSIRH
jgi:hypothetical protein